MLNLFGTVGTSLKSYLENLSEINLKTQMPNSDLMITIRKAMIVFNHKLHKQLSQFGVCVKELFSDINNFWFV